MVIGLSSQVLVEGSGILLFNMPSPEASVLSQSVGDVPFPLSFRPTFGIDYAHCFSFAIRFWRR